MTIFFPHPEGIDHVANYGSFFVESEERGSDTLHFGLKSTISVLCRVHVMDMGYFATMDNMICKGVST